MKKFIFAVFFGMWVYPNLYALSTNIGSGSSQYLDNIKIDIPAGEKVSLGRTSSVNKFGRAPSGIQATATDVWDRADATPTQQIWVAPTQARIHDIASTDAADDGSPAADGARTLRVFGLTSWDTDETSEDITMNGTTNVATSNSYVIIHRMYVITKGTSSANVGTITATAQTDSTVTAQVNAGEGQTQMCIYGVPSTKKAYITQFYGTVNKAGGAVATINFSLLVDEEPDVEETTFLTKNTRGLQSTGNSSDVWTFNPFIKVTGPAIIKIQGIASAADVEASGGFDIILVDN